MNHDMKLPLKAVLLAALASPGAANASEDFQLRYNLAGSLGGELFAAREQTGWAGGLAFTSMAIRQVTGDDGQPLTRPTPGGVLALSNMPPAWHPAYDAGTVQVAATGAMRQANLALGYITAGRHAGGRLAFLFNLPFSRKEQRFEASGTPPALHWDSAVPAPVRAAATAGFERQYLAGLERQADAAGGQVTGIGDAELQAGWLYVREKVRALVGASIVLPTGKYRAAAGPDIGYGNFYTIRPSVQVTGLVTPEVAISGKLTWGANTRNRDNDLRSGNWAGVELAAGYKTPLGVVGVHGLRIQQYQDDSHNPWGAARLRTMNAGLFVTTKLDALNAAVTLQHMTTTASRNARHGVFSQLRVIKFF